MPWELLARQTASAAMPVTSRPRSAWASVGDPADTTAPNYSVLSLLRPMFGSGPYTLKMKWPGGSLSKDQVWQQTSAPDKALGRGVSAEGYKAISANYDGNCEWKGLQLCDAHAYVCRTCPCKQHPGTGNVTSDASVARRYICNLSPNGNWFFPIGTDEGWGSAPRTEHFPGPCADGNHPVTVVELWLWVDHPWGWGFIVTCLVLSIICAQHHRYLIEPDTFSSPFVSSCSRANTACCLLALLPSISRLPSPLPPLPSCQMWAVGLLLQAALVEAVAAGSKRTPTGTCGLSCTR